MKKAVIYVLGILITFASIEALVRSNESYFYALSDKILLKIEFLKKRQTDQIVFLGTSRTQDGLDPSLFQKELKSRYDIDLRTFNAATAGQNTNRILYSLKRLLEMENIETLIIESSSVGLHEGALGIDFKEDTSLEEDEVSNGHVEDSLQQFMVDTFATVRVRKAFKLKAVFRLVMIWSSNKYNHDLWFMPGILRQISFGAIKKYEPKDFTPYTPKILFSKGDSIENTSQYSDFLKIIDLLKNTDKKIIFYNPPVALENAEKDCNASRHQMYQSIKLKKPTLFIDYTCKGFPKDSLRDSSHLNLKGRLYFTQMLAHDLAPFLKEGM